MAQGATSQTESLQCLACAALQELGDLNEITLLNLMQKKNKNAKDYIEQQGDIYANVKIDSKVQREMSGWAKRPQNSKLLQEWLSSSVTIAKALRDNNKATFSGKYTFYRQDQIPGKGKYKDFKKVFIQLLKNINEKAKSSDARDFFTKSAGKVYQSISGMKDDKWNPADIIAVKHGKESEWTSFIQNFISEREKDKKNTSSAIKGDLSAWAARLKKQAGGDKISQRKIDIILAMEDVYVYNKEITKGIDDGDFIPISLKKSEVDSPTVQYIKVSEPADIDEYFTMRVEQTAVNYKKDSPAASIEFNLITGQSQDWVFDIRSFSPRGKIGDLDVELKKPGAAAAQGKIALSVSSNITQLSGGRKAFSIMKKKRKQFWDEQKPPGTRGINGVFFKHTASQNYKFTNYNIFSEMHRMHEKNMKKRKRGLGRADIGFDKAIQEQKLMGRLKGKESTVVDVSAEDPDQIVNSIKAWANYAEWLSGGEFKYAEFMKGALGRKQWDALLDNERKKNKSYEVTVAQTQAKWMRGKIQSYEQAWVLDNQGNENPLTKEVQDNLHKSMWMYAASKGFAVFNKNNVVAYMLSGPYLKCAA